MAFEQLATETSINIVKYASIDGTTSSWLSLASCNRNLNSIASPILYLHFMEEGRASVLKLPRTVLAEPQLATYVRLYTGYGISIGLSKEQLELYGMLRQEQNNFMAQMFQYQLSITLGPDDAVFLNVSELQIPDFSAFREAMEMTGAAQNVIVGWMSRIRDGKWRTLTSLLLLHLPNLRGRRCERL